MKNPKIKHKEVKKGDRFLNTLSWIKKNYFYLSGFTVLLGGIYQLFRISLIGFEYWGLFSITQFLIDGIIITIFTAYFLLFLILCFYLSVSYNMGVFVIYKDEKEQRIKDKRNHRISNLILVVLIILIGGIYWNKLLDLKVFYPVFGFWIFLLMLIIGNIRKRFNHLSSNQNLWIGLLQLVFATLIGLLMFIVIQYVGFFKTHVYDLSKTTNYKEFSSSILKKDENIYEVKILYYNDKYLFSEIRTRSDTLIKISSFQDFIEEDN